MDKHSYANQNGKILLFHKIFIDKWTQNHNIFSQQEQSEKKVGEKVIGTLPSLPFINSFLLQNFC